MPKDIEVSDEHYQRLQIATNALAVVMEEAGITSAIVTAPKDGLVRIDVYEHAIPIPDGCCDDHD